MLTELRGPADQLLYWTVDVNVIDFGDGSWNGPGFQLHLKSGIIGSAHGINLHDTAAVKYPTIWVDRDNKWKAPHWRERQYPNSPCPEFLKALHVKYSMNGASFV